MTQPKTQIEFNVKTIQNSRASDWGLDTKQHFPCPGCAEPDWKIVRVVDTTTEMAKESTCQHCGRSFKVNFEFVQTGGDDLPDWYEPKLRRV